MKRVILILGMTLCYLVSFTQETGTFTDPRDGKVYKTVKVGNETWMAENLAYIPSVNPSSVGSETAPCYYVYDYQGTDVSEAKATQNYKTYGVLYNWEAAKLACPAGWHLPTLSGQLVLENELIDYLKNNGYGVGNKNNISKSIAAKSGWTSYAAEGTIGNDQTSNNKTGLTVLPGGLRYGDGTFADLKNNAALWSSSKAEGLNPSSHANSLVLYYASRDVIYHTTFKSTGMSVRCIKNE